MISYNIFLIIFFQVGGFGPFNYFLMAFCFLTTFMNGINYYAQGKFQSLILCSKLWLNIGIAFLIKCSCLSSPLTTTVLGPDTSDTYTTTLPFSPRLHPRYLRVKVHENVVKLLYRLLHFQFHFWSLGGLDSDKNRQVWRCCLVCLYLCHLTVKNEIFRWGELFT